MAFTWARVRPMRTNLAAKSPVNGRQEFSTKSRPGDAICYGSRAFVGCSLVFRRLIILLGIAAVAALSLCACGRNGSLELPPGPAGIQPAPAALNAPPPGPVASDASTALPPPGPTAGIQPAPAALSAPPPGPVASDASTALPPPGPTAGIQPAPAALSAPPPGPVASDASTALPTSQDTIAKTGFDAHGNPAATPGQKKPFFLDWLLQ
jgi:predicted small lipoprotein YifL